MFLEENINPAVNLENQDALMGRCLSEIFQPVKETWNVVKDQIVAIENENFADHCFEPELLENDFTNPRNTIVLSKDKESDKIIGFVYAQPIEDVEENREKEAGETAYISDTAILKAYQGHHLVGPMMQLLEKELKKRGYKFVERHSRVANNYAANVAKSYKERIVQQGEPADSEWGQQVFFRIKL